MTLLTRRAFVHRALGAAAAATPLVAAFAAQPARSRGPLLAYVATYSSPPLPPPPGKVDVPPGNGRGIHIFEINRATGAMTARGVFELGTSPTCLAVNSAGTRMYSTNATDQFEGTDSGSISSFSIDRTDGTLTLLNTVSSGGSGPTYISLHPSGRFALVANYAGGTAAVLPIQQDGRLGAPTDIKKGSGAVGPRKAASAPPGSFAISGHDFGHAHMIESDPSGRFALVADLGLDQIIPWKFDERGGKLSPNDPPSVALPAGDGPRHFAFHPNGAWLYSLQEEGSTIVLWDFESTRGRLTSRQTISSLPAGFAGSSFASEILVSRDGQYVYAANRLHDSITWFFVRRDGTLAYSGSEWTRGDYPRSFAFDPTGNFLYCCNQRADAVTVFRVDRTTGKLNFTGQYVPVGNPSMLTFIDLGTG